MLGGNKRKMKNMGGNMMRNNMNRKNFQQQNFNQQLDNSGFMDFSNNFNDQQQQISRQQNNMNNMNNKRKMNGQQNRSPKKNMNFQNGNNKNWNNQQPLHGRAPPPSMINQQNQFQQFNPNPSPQMNQRMPPVNFRNNGNNNMRNNASMNFPPMQGRRGPQMNMGGGGGPMGGPLPLPPMNMRSGGRPPMRRQFQKPFNNNMRNNNNQNRKNPNLTKVDKPKNRKMQQNVNKKNVGNRAKKRQRDPYSLEAPFVTDEIREEHKKKEDILESLKGKGKNDELFAKFKEQRDIFVKKYDEAKIAYQAEKKAQREAAKAAKAEEAAATAAAAETAQESKSTDPISNTQTENENMGESIASENPASEGENASVATQNEGVMDATPAVETEPSQTT